MPSDAKNPTVGSMSAEQLAEKLEKSEAGRKKLRQAISILQEKLDATDKVLKINETLRQECERERQRAEEEKKKAEEEKRIRFAVEKDSSTLKEQLVKVIQRLGVVENRQKSDRKETDRLRAEVKLAVEGARAAAQAVDAVQSSLQCLENNLLEKVNEAVKRVDAVSQEVDAVQGSLQSLGKKVSEKTELVTQPVLNNEAGYQLQGSVDDKLGFFKINNRPEKLVDNITHLFFKEKKSHLKIERKLAALKGLLKRSRNDECLSNIPVDFTSKDIKSSKRRRADEIGKKTSVQDEVLASSRSRKKRRHTQQEENPKCFFGKNIEREEQFRNNKNSRFFDISKMPQMSERPESILQSTLKTHLGHIPSKEHVEAKNLEGEGLLKGSCDDGLMSSAEDPKMILVDCHQKLLSGKDTLKIGSNIEESTRSIHFNEVVINESEEHLGVNSSDSELELDWLSGEMTLLSPNLPEVPSPVCDSPSSSMDISVNGTCAAICPELEVDQNHVALQSDEAVLNRGARAYIDMSDEQGDLENLKPFAEYGKERTTFSGSNSSLQLGCNKNVEVKPSIQTRGQVASGTDVGQQNGLIEWDCQHIKGKETRGTGQMQIDQLNQNEVLIHTTCISMSCNGNGCIARQEQSFESLNEAFPVSSCLSAPKSVMCNLSGGAEDKDQRFNEDFGFEAVDSDIIKEMNNFLEDLPSISCISTNEIPSNLSGVASGIQMVEDDCLKSRENSCLNPIETFGNNFSASGNDISAKDSNVSIKVLHNQRLNNSTEFSTASDISNIVAGNRGSQRDAKSSCRRVVKQSSSLISLLQGFDLHIIEGETTLAMAAVVAINVKKYLSCTGLNSQQTELQRALVSFTTNPKLPFEYIACSFISSAVDMVSLESKGECSSLKAKSFSFLLQTFAALIESVFKEDATAILDIMFTQLSRFLNEGNMIFISFQGIEGFNEELFVSAGLMPCNSLLSCGTSRATLEDIHAGSKVLAGLCQVLSCVSHLQTVVYEVLGCCDKDTAWLLTIFSSFASICGHTFFMLGPDDLLGHTICAIVSELVSNADRDSVKGLEIIDQALKCSADVFQMPKEWEPFKGSPRIEEKSSLEAALFSVLMALCDIFFLTNDPRLSESRQVLKDNLPSNDEKVEHSSPRQTIVTNLPDIQQSKTSVSFNEVDMPGTAVEQRLSKQDVDKTLYTQSLVEENSETIRKRQDCTHLNREQAKSVILDWKKWRRKYCEVIGSLELIALYMGWEWTYNDLLVGHLWRVVVSGSAKIRVAVISHVIGILARFGVDNERKELPGLEELKTCLISVLHSKATTTATSEKHYFSFLSQAAAAHALLKLNNASCTKRNISHKSENMDSNKLDPDVKNGNSPTSVNMERLKEWLYDSGIESREALPKFLKNESTISKLLPP